MTTVTPHPNVNERSFPADWLPALAKIAERITALPDFDANEELPRDMYIDSVELVIRHSDGYQVGTFHLEDGEWFFMYGEWFMYNPGSD